jgi:lysyl-tRNA synthetase class 2
VTAKSPWWDKRVHEDRRPLLLARGRIKEAMRRYFLDQGFVEVECGALQVSPGNEAHLSAFATTRIAPGGEKERLYLHTSPEFACKKLLAAGETRIFTFAPVYRNRELGRLHAPEFTMLEWYRTKENYDAVIADCLALVKIAAATGGIGTFAYRGLNADPKAEALRLTVSEAFDSFAGIDLLSTVGPDGAPDRSALAAQTAIAGIATAANDSWSDIFSRVLVEKIEPRLGIGRPTILDRYPRAEAALARATASDPRVAERFELYLCGVEIANGFGELTDAREQRRRFEAEMDEKERIYGERYPIDEEFLSALDHMPAASGVALGFDRLAMLATGADNIARVMWTPADN